MFMTQPLQVILFRATGKRGVQRDQQWEEGMRSGNKEDYAQMVMIAETSSYEFS